MKSRTLIIIALFCLLLPFLIDPSFIISTNAMQDSPNSFNSITPHTGSIPIPEGFPVIPNPDYSGVGTARSTHEIANRTGGNQDILLYYDSSSQTPNNDSASVVLPPGWTGYQLDFSIFDLYENRSWLQNPSFDGNSDYWAWGYANPGWPNTFPSANNQWISGGPDGNGYVRVQENGYWRDHDPDPNVSSYYYDYDENDRAYWRQTYSINRSDLAWAAIKMDFRIDSAWNENALFNVYIRINGSHVWAQGFQAVGDDNWHNTGLININTALFDIPTSAIEVEVGIISTMTVGYSSNSWIRGEFDNIELYTKTKVYPTEINLKMNGISVPNNPSRGDATLTQIPSSVWTNTPVIAQLNWTPTPIPPVPDLDIRVTGVVDLILYANKTGITLYSQSPTAIGVQFDTSGGQNVTWSFYYQLALPTQYWNDVFNFTIPVDWEVVFVSEPQLPLINVLGQCQGGAFGDGYLSIPTTDITVSPDGYWYIEAESHNYVDSAELQIDDGSWTPTSAIRAGNTTRVVAQILDGLNIPPVGVTTTQANVSIYQPDGGLWYSELVTPTAAGWVYSTSFNNDGWNTTGGTYTISVSWDNSTEAGEYSSTYTMDHSTTLIPREPLIESFLEDQPLFPKVRYEDSDSHAWLEPPATITGNWTTGTITFNYVSGTGYWEAEINAQDPGTVGQYWIKVDASKSYYDSASCIIIIDLVSETKVETPQSGGVEVPWRGNTTINVRYSQIVGDVGITNAEVTVNWTAGFYEVTEGADGWYNVEINSTGPGAIGSYLLNITLYKERYQRQQVRIALFVTPMTLVVTSTVSEPVNVVYGEQFWVEVYVENFLGEPFNTANVTFSWIGGSTYNDTGVNALYGVWLNSSLGNIGVHYLTAYVTGPNAVPEIQYILINVEQIGSILDTVPPGEYYLTYIVGESFPLPVNYTTQYGDGVELANVTYSVGHLNGIYNEVGGGIYNVTVDTTGLVAGSYTIYVTASSVNVDSQSRAVSLILTLSPAALEPESGVLNVYWGDDFKVNVFYRNLVNDSGITNADVYYFWGNLTGTLLPNVTKGIGWYYIDLPSDIFAAGAIYDVTLTCQKPSFQFSLTTVTINILSVPADFTLVRVQTIYSLNGQNITTELDLANWEVPRGER